MLHFYAFYLPTGVLTKEQISNFLEFIECFVAMLPCPGCSFHATSYLIEHAYTLRRNTTGRQMFEWTVTFHNHVNGMRRQREFTFMEAESALLMHLTGNSNEQFAIEDRHTNEQLKIRKWKRKLLILQNKAHKVEPEVTDERLIQMLAHQNASMSFETYDTIFRAFFLIALEHNYEKPLTADVSRAMCGFLRCAMILFPNAKVALDSVAFFEQHKPHFVNGQDIFAYVVQWQNHITGNSKTTEATRQDMNVWAQQVTKRQFAMISVSIENQKTIRNLESQYEELFAQKQQQDANNIPIPGDKKQNLKMSTTEAALCAAVIALVIILVVFIVLYANAPTKPYTKHPISSPVN